MESKAFDDIIKNKLDQPVKLEDQRAWDLFMLSALEKGEDNLFEDKSTDVLVRNALQDHKVDYDAKSWDSLLEKIKEDESEPVIVHKFDKEISNSLKSLKRKYDAGSWPRLAARMEAEEKYINHYYQAKVVEAVLFFLLVLTIFQFTQSDTFNNSEVRKDVLALIHPSLKSTASRPRSLLEPDEAHVMHSLPRGLNVISTDHPGNELFNHLGQSISGFATLKSKNSVNQFFRINDRAPYVASEIKTVNSIASSNQTNDIIQIRVAQLSKLSLPLESRIISDGAIGIKNNELRDEWAVLSVPDLTKTFTSGEWRIGMYARQEFNQISLPDQYIKTQPFKAKTINSSGYGAGFKATYTYNKVGFETGLGYANRSYAPDRRYYGDKLYNYYFKNIEYNIIEFPLLFRYGANSSHRLKTYAQAGFNSSIITSAIYDVKEEPLQVSTLLAKTGASKEENALRNIVKGDFQKFDKRRVFIYAQLAAGAEWKATLNQSIYSQITIGKRLFNDFGPNFDQVKNISLELGIRTKI